mmetsp:Transcript_160364/g.292837  ORF Transcript_160364/g.292837 Transcript_160364/m.292837 type:complete len:264 (-) Transcript_160364:744-1535(-)
MYGLVPLLHVELLLLPELLHPSVHLLLPLVHELLIFMQSQELVQCVALHHAEQHLGLGLHCGLSHICTEGGELPKHISLTQERNEMPTLPHFNLALCNPVYEVPIREESLALHNDVLPLVELLCGHPAAQLMQEVHAGVLEDLAGSEEMRIRTLNDATKTDCTARKAGYTILISDLPICADGIVQCHEALPCMLEESHPCIGILGKDRDHNLPGEHHTMTLRSCDDVGSPPLQEVKHADLTKEVVFKPAKELTTRCHLHGPTE